MDQASSDLIDFIQTKIIKDPGVKITPSTLLFKNRFIDSINILTLIGYIEQKLGRRLSDDEVVMSNFASIEAMVKAFLS